MMQRVSSALMFLGALSLVLGACSDDDGNGMGDIDASMPMVDAAEPDAGIDAPPAAMRAGTIAVLDLALTNDVMPAPPNPIRGAMVHIKYSDLTVSDVEPAFDNRMGEAQIGCAVWVYEVGTSMPQPGVDEGAVTIMGTESPVGTCAFDGTDYRCSNGGGTTAGTVASLLVNGDGTANINALSNLFQNQDLEGSRVLLEGFTDDANNGLFAVIAKNGEASITIANPDAVEELPISTDVTYTIYTGGGPTAAGRAFLGGDTDTLSISKEAGGIVPEINLDIIPSGLGLMLDTESTLLHDLPVNPAGEASVSCNPAMGGTCGVAVPPLYGQVVSGWTTDGDISVSPMPNYMPAPVTTWARFECRSQANDPVVIPVEAIQALVDTGATRIETSLWRVTESLGLHPFTDFFVGHGLVGYTDVPPAP